MVISTQGTSVLDLVYDGDQPGAVYFNGISDGDTGYVITKQPSQGDVDIVWSAVSGLTVERRANPVTQANTTQIYLWIRSGSIVHVQTLGV